MKRSWLETFVQRPIAILMICLTLLVMGGLSLIQIPLEQFPSGISRFRINIIVPLDNMTPQEAEDQIYAPLEGQLLTVPGVKNISGRIQRNRVRVRVEASKKIPLRQTMAEVRDRLQRARLSWPSFVDRWWTWSESSDSMPLFFFGIGVPDQSQHWQDLVEFEIKPKLEAIEGVGEVSLWGQVGENVRIFFDRNKIQQFGINYRQVLRQLQTDNSSQAVGVIHEGGSRYLVRTDYRYTDLDQIRDLPIGKGLRIRDIARVEKVRSLRDSVSRINGKFSLGGMIRRSAGSNAIATSKRVRGFFDQLAHQPDTKGVEPFYYFDQGKFIEDSLKTLLNSAWQGALLAFLVLFFFLRRIGMTLVVVFSLPLSLLFALTVHFFQHGTLNLFSMLGLTLSIGMLVDNSVVVLENIYRLREKGLSWYRSCVDGVREVSLPVFLATMTTLAIWIPLLIFVDDPTAKAFTWNLAMPLCVALIGSLFVALVILPAAIAWLNRGSRGERHEVDMRKGLVHRFTSLQVAIVGKLIRFPLLSFTGLLVLCIGTLYVCISNTRRVPQERRGPNVSIEFETPKGTTLGEASRMSARYENFVGPLRKRFHFTDVRARFSRNNVSLRLSMEPEASLEDKDRLVSYLRKNVLRYPGVEVKVRAAGVENDDGPSEDKRGFFLLLKGRDSEGLRIWGQDLAAQLLERGLAEEIDWGSASNQDELRLQIDRNRMQELGVDPGVLFGFVNSGLSGRQVSRYITKEGQEIPLVAEFDDVADLELKDLKEMQIWSMQTGFQPLGDLAKFQFTKGFQEIRRENGVLTTYLAGRRPENLGMPEFMERTKGLVQGMSLPRGFQLEFGGNWRDNDRTLQEVAKFAGPGLLLIFLVMGLLFESVLLPLAILPTILVAVPAGWGTVLLTGTPFEAVMAILGFFILAGVIVNNGIVFLDHVERLRRDEGLERNKALLQGVRDRFRPILMTALTTVVGLLPMALATKSADGFSYRVMALIVSGGLLFGTVMTPITVSICYAALSNLKDSTRRAMARVRVRWIPASGFQA